MNKYSILEKLLEWFLAHGIKVLGILIVASLVD